MLRLLHVVLSVLVIATTIGGLSTSDALAKKSRSQRDLSSLKHALKQFLPQEVIHVGRINKTITLSGNIARAEAAERAIQIAKQFAGKNTEILNFMQIKTGQQVMLRVRVGEIQRTALKRVGFNLQAIRNAGNVTGNISMGGGIGNTFGSIPGATGAFGVGGVVYNTTKLDLSATLDLLEQDGLFKMLAEPNLVAISGEDAEFLAGGEFPVPIAQGHETISVQYKPFGVKVAFSPLVLSPNRLRLKVEPEVSEVNSDVEVQASGFSLPSIATRRAKTTVELAPGESFMIAGLIKDDMRTTLQHIPGIGDIPVFGALFRSTAFQRNETELVIAVTPYLVDPVLSKDVRLPTDNFHTPSTLEMLFFGSLGARSGDRLSGGGLEGPVGYIAE